MTNGDFFGCLVYILRFRATHNYIHFGNILPNLEITYSYLINTPSFASFQLLTSMFSSVQLRNAGYTIKSLVENDNLPKLKLFMQRLIDTKVFGTNEYLIPLYYAAFFGRFKILMWLMKKSKCGADMEIRFTSNNKSVLCNFTGHPIDMDMETFLYQRQVDPYDIIYFQQRSPLLSIAAAGTSNAHVAIVEHLL